MQNRENIVHELKNALSVSSGLLDLLATTDPSEEQVAILDRLYASFSLFQSILDRKEHCHSIVLEDFLLKIHDMCSTITCSKGLTLNQCFHVDKGTVFIADEVHLTQVIINLVKNASKFTESGCITLFVKQRSDDGVPLLEFCIEDTGVGISAENITRIFDPHVQINDSDTAASEGSGLGLAICKDLVEMMGGAIWAESEPGTGSRFYFTIVPSEISLCECKERECLN